MIPYKWKRRAVLPLTGRDYLRAVLVLASVPAGLALVVWWLF